MTDAALDLQDVTDGRHAWRERNRNAAADALLDLYNEGVATPSGRRAIDALKPSAPLQAGNLEDVPSYHITTIEVAEIARAAGVCEVVLTHVIPSIVSQDGMEAVFVQGMSEIYKGAIRVARDTQRLSVKGAE